LLRKTETLKKVRVMSIQKNVTVHFQDNSNLIHTVKINFLFFVKVNIFTEKMSYHWGM
jgi:hypothetical protein